MRRVIPLFYDVVIGPIRVAAARMVGLVREEPLPHRPLVMVAGGLVVGALVVRALPTATMSVALPCWLAGVAALVGWRWTLQRQRPRWAAATLVAAAMAAGAAWSSARFDLFPHTDLAWQLGDTPRPVAVRGRVVTTPQPVRGPINVEGGEQVIDPASEFLLEVESIRDQHRWRPANGRAHVIVRGQPVRLDVGLELTIFGRGLRSTAPLNPGELDREALARGERCLSLVRVSARECITVGAGSSWWSPAAALDRLRNAGRAVLAAGIAPERLALAHALLLGGHGAMPRDLAADFVATGTVHVLSISGLHLGLLAGGLFAVLRAILVPRGWSLVVVAGVSGIYAVLVGAETPVFRALIMVWVACLAAATGRRGSAINALAAAAIAVVVWRPAEVASPGGQLSFLSTAVLVGAATLSAKRPEYDPIARLVERSRSPGEKAIRRACRALTVAFILSLAVSLATAPLVAARFHVISPVGLVANVVIAPLVPVAMGCGLLCLVTASVSAPLAGVFAAGCDITLALLGNLVAAAADVPAGHAWVVGPSWWWVVGWYMILTATAVWGRRDLVRQPATWAAVGAGWCGVGLVLGAFGGAAAPPVSGLRVVVAAVGHGCGVLVRAPTGRSLLYDAGRLGGPAAAGRSLSAVLWSERLTRIDTLVISHADADHFNAVPELLSRFGCGEILVPEAFQARQSPAVISLLAAAAARGVPVRTARAGDAFAVDPLCRVRVLHPSAGAAIGDGRDDDNSTSLVLSVESAGRRLLLTGDLEGAALASFVASGPGDCDVLLAPHHGAATSLPADIAAATAPRIVLVSGRGGPTWPAVRAAYAAAAGTAPSAVLQTGQEGALAVGLTAEGMTTERFQSGRWQVIESVVDQFATAWGRVRNHPPASSSNWLATYAPSRSSTPLVKP